MSVSSPQPLSLRDDSIFRLFWRYTLPTIAAMLVTGIYVAVDGMFVGHFIGEDGLAAIILAIPLDLFFTP